jgi:hypothetical protein
MTYSPDEGETRITSRITMRNEPVAPARTPLFVSAEYIPNIPCFVDDPNNPGLSIFAGIFRKPQVEWFRYGWSTLAAPLIKHLHF